MLSISSIFKILLSRACGVIALRNVQCSGSAARFPATFFSLGLGDADTGVMSDAVDWLCGCLPPEKGLLPLGRLYTCHRPEEAWLPLHVLRQSLTRGLARRMKGACAEAGLGKYFCRSIKLTPADAEQSGAASARR